MTWSAAMRLPALAMLLCLLVVEAKPNDSPAVESDTDEDDSNAEQPSSTENATDDSTEEEPEKGIFGITRFFDWLWNLFFGGEKGHKANEEEELKGGEGANTRLEAAKAGLLKSFCGMEPGEKEAVDCSCCADHLTGHPLRVAALLYGGGASAEAPALHHSVNPRRSPPINGRVRIWSIGQWIPSVWCYRGLPVCRCEDPTQAWTVTEPACRAGAACLPPTLPEELSSTPLNDTLPEPPPGLPGCASDSSSPRIPIGSAHCEDMSVRQCAEFYARGKNGWHYCKVAEDAVRICSAKLSGDLAERTKEELHMDLWIVQQAYNPDLNWTVVEQEDHTSKVVGNPMPPAEEVRNSLRSWGMPPQRGRSSG